ncbi:MAG: hypothetical protein ACQEXX_01880 [Bacillota bacterium]
MAAPKKGKDIAETIDTNVVDIEKDRLVAEVEELKALVQKLMVKNVEQPTMTTSKNTDEDFFDIEEELNINPNQLVKIVSMTEGGLNLKGNAPQPLYLPEFGATRAVTYEELRSIFYNHSELTREGAFFILNKNVVKALYLEDDYKKLINKDKLDKIVDLPASEILSVLKNLTKIQRETFIQRFIIGIRQNDNRYSDFNKIKAIDDYIGNSLMSLANQEE